jgi:hypothetical protein
VLLCGFAFLGPFALLLVSISLHYVLLRFIEISETYTCPRLPSTVIWWTWLTFYLLSMAASCLSCLGMV